MSSPFPVAILNGTCFFGIKKKSVIKLNKVVIMLLIFCLFSECAARAVTDSVAAGIPRVRARVHYVKCHVVRAGEPILGMAPRPSLPHPLAGGILIYGHVSHSQVIIILSSIFYDNIIIHIVMDSMFVRKSLAIIGSVTSSPVE